MRQKDPGTRTGRLRHLLSVCGMLCNSGCTIRDDECANLYSSQRLRLASHLVCHLCQRTVFTMKLFKDCWIAILQLLDAFTLSPTGRSALQNSPAGLKINPPRISSADNQNGGFEPFNPPSRAEDRDDSIRCNYPEMGDQWEFCGTENRSCWLQNKKNSSLKYSIDTDYEFDYPLGVVRHVCHPFFLHSSSLCLR